MDKTTTALRGRWDDRPLTTDALKALMAVMPRVPAYYAVAPDVMASIRRLATNEPRDPLAALRGLEIREDAALPVGTWEARNRDGSPFTLAAPAAPEVPRVR